MKPAWDYDQVCDELGRAFQTRYPDGQGQGVRMVGLLFALPEVRLAAAEIIPGLDYFHRRSGHHIDFFCAGYYRFDTDSRDKAVTTGKQPWMFSLDRFERFRDDISRRSKWRYSGEADLLLLNGIRDKGGTVSLDFGSAIVCDLDLMIQDQAIRSVRRFFEDIFKFAEGVPAPDPTWGFSDEMGIRTAGSALKGVALSVLPKGLEADYRRAEHFAIRDVSRT